MLNQKCDCCGSIGGFHMENCPRKGYARIFVFMDKQDITVGTLVEVLPEDYSARFVRKEGGHWENCFGYSVREFFQLYSLEDIDKMFSDPRINKEYFISLLYSFSKFI